ncbi:thioester-containing protein 1 allele R1-like isoform X1 [Musca autumnalis]|uniref:thioester-containing protein 1 allele R1-like isoform X1 n=1 Tax=Musca autumnalis TaxID=221902 RepID=UPI003CF4ED79
MYHSRLILFVLVSAHIAVFPVICTSHYSIVAPGTIRSNRNYSVCVTLHDAAQAATLRLSVRSLTSSMHLSQDVTVQPFEIRLISFMPPKLYDKFQYELKVEGIQGIILSESKPLYAMEEGGPRIYIESDRAFYKPSDIVQFRVVILNEHLRLTNIVEPIRIQILDSQENRVKQYKDIRLDRGVFAGKFQLSQQPLLGNWTISVFISGKYNMKKDITFKVEKYVLPKFSVHIENPRNVVEQDLFIPVTIYGKYTFGRYVEGFVDVYLEDEIGYTAGNVSAYIGSGEAKVDLLLNFSGLKSPLIIYIRAKLRERHSNVTAEANSVLFVHRQRYYMDYEIEYRNGNPYRFNVHVQHLNGTKVRDVQTPVKMLVADREYSSRLNENGVAQFEVDVGNVSIYKFSFKCSTLTVFKSSVEDQSHIFDSSNCQITKLQSSSDIKDPIEIMVRSNQSIPYIIYTITSHGNIIDQKYIPLSSQQKAQKITIKPTMAMVPNSYLFVYYIINGDLHYCELKLSLPEKFENQISISAPRNVKPGQNITFNVMAEPNSRVSIVAVDKSVLLLSADNILERDMIMSGLRTDISYIKQDCKPNVYEVTPGYTSGLVIFTNAKYNIHTFDIISTYAGYGEIKPSYTRGSFPETWIFKDVDIFEPNTSLTFRVPDTITTWSVRAFSVNDKTGLGMLDDSLDIVTFQPFFLSVTLPYAVKRGEVLAIPVTVFNYLNDIFATEMKMFNNKNEFQFMNAENQPITTDVDTRELSVPANSGRSTTFTITPQRIGYIEIHIEAKNAITSDAVVHKLKVEPEGIAHNGNREQVITCTNGKTENINFKADIPSNIVPESEYLLLSISGDAMATTVENLDKLVQKPSGCGEQNMINLVPNILILDYLKILKKYNNKTDTIEHAKHFIDTGYQRELTYRHSNGAYSVFGPTSKSTENNWLTAYVTRFFIRAQKYSAIENRIIEDGLEYLTAQQLDDGSFPQRGFLFDPSHQNEYGFSAFVLLAFMEDAKYAKKYKSAIDKGMNYLRHNLPNVNDIYSLAIMANVFQKAGSSNDANLILEKLKPEGRINNGLKWWTKNNKNEESANDVEITSYILMALLESSPHEDYSSIYNWLLKQRNSKGGFGSTQDTVVGLQALIKYAEKASTSQNTNVKVQFVAKCGEDKNRKEGLITVDVSNALILQSEELPNSTRSVDVVVMGLGRVYVQFSYQYYTSQAMAGSPSSVVTETSNNRKSNAILKFSTRMGETTMPLPSPSSSSVPALPSLLGPSSTALQAPQASTIVWEYFHITPTAKITSTNDMSLEVCYTYQPFTEEEKLTNMVIMEIKFPSGYMANNDNLASLRDEEQISRIDSQNSATLIAIYFEKLEANDEQCLTAVADKIHDVTSLKASTIDMYDYYNDKRRTTVLYELKE